MTFTYHQELYVHVTTVYATAFKKHNIGKCKRLQFNSIKESFSLSYNHIVTHLQTHSTVHTMCHKLTSILTVM